MFKNLANLASLMKSAQQMGSKMQEVNEDLKRARVFGAAGGDMVKVEMNGLGETLSVSIDPSLFARGDREMLEDLTTAAINQAQAKAKQAHVEAMKKLTEGVDVPGLGDALAQFSGQG